MWSIACMAKLNVMNSTIGFSPAKRRADADAGETVLGDRRVDDALGAELLQQALRDLVGALILGDLLAHHEHAVVGAHLLGHGVAQRLAHGRSSPSRCLPARRAPAAPSAAAGSAAADSTLAGRRCAGAFAGGLRPSTSAGARLGRFASALALGLGAAVLERGGVLALAEDQRDRRVDLDVLGALRRRGSCRACPRRRPRPPWWPCRSRSRR